jgi:hypothetical protein
MKVLLGFALAFILAGSATAQHGGGGGHGGGIGGHGSIGGIGHGGGVAIGHGGGIGIGYGGVGGHGFIGSGFGFHGVGGYHGAYVYPWYGLGYSYWPGYYGPYGGYPSYGAYPSYGYSYQPSPNVTVVYPPSQTAPAVEHEDRAQPITRTYDEYGQEVPAANGDNRGRSSPTYLIAFKDHTIRAASAYWVDGETLHYITLQREERRAALNTVDREFSSQLNRERRVSFQLPAR